MTSDFDVPFRGVRGGRGLGRPLTGGRMHPRRGFRRGFFPFVFGPWVYPGVFPGYAPCDTYDRYGRCCDEWGRCGYMADGDYMVPGRPQDFQGVGRNPVMGQMRTEWDDD